MVIGKTEKLPSLMGFIKYSGKDTLDKESIKHPKKGVASAHFEIIDEHELFLNSSLSITYVRAIIPDMGT